MAARKCPSKCNQPKQPNPADRKIARKSKREYDNGGRYRKCSSLGAGESLDQSPGIRHTSAPHPRDCDSSEGLQTQLEMFQEAACLKNLGKRSTAYTRKIAENRFPVMPVHPGRGRVWYYATRRPCEGLANINFEPERSRKNSAEKTNKMDMIGFFRTYDSSPAAQALCFALGRMHPALPGDALTEKIRVFAQSPQNSLEDAANRAALVALIAAGE